ncbi:tRNA lysidine(34) synthetase TilS [uncultured Nonlabens sp.]|uniref:tRNA lysidine(34) synthetase TilS n=1 Tax=uncultured Nonlabens sp. TaxID=859306 RepID=UPI0026082864|nr:tRNA lysidine(34) synthetase TilS [uncultured Nonlabens sp.]
MLLAFKNHIKNHFPEFSTASIAVAISGGKDSVVLAYLLDQLDFNFELIHCNFHLRDLESDGDQIFVEKMAANMDRKLHVLHFDTSQVAQDRNISIQMAARDLRYEAFDKIAVENKFQHILVAHHLDDQLETFLINLGRGAGLHGLTGIRERNGFISRPLLPFSRGQISDYATQNHIEWREDSSNSSTKYLRNKLRHDVIPLLHDALPHLEGNFSNTLSYLKNSELLQDVEVARFRESGTKTISGNLTINIELLKKTLKPDAYLFELLKNYRFNIHDAVKLLDSENGKTIKSGEMRLVKDRDALILSGINDINEVHIEIDEKTTAVTTTEVNLEIKHILNKDLLTYVKNNSSNNKLFLDTSKLTMPLILRTWQHGDRIQPYGMRGSKLISDVLTDSKISSLKREKALVLTSGNDLIWLVGKRASKHHKITSRTQSIIEITIKL